MIALPLLRPKLWIYGLLPGAVLLSGWAGFDLWYTDHIARRTGRADIPRVSCGHCHAAVDDPHAPAGPEAPEPFLPEGIAVSPDGRRLYVAAGKADRLLELDPVGGRVIRETRIDGNPHGVTVSPDGRTVAVTCRANDEVVLIDAASLIERRTIPTGREPLAAVFSRDGRRLYVSDGGDDDILVADAASQAEPVRLVAGHEPYALDLSQGGDLLAVANRLARPAPPLTIPVSEVTLIDPRVPRVRDRRELGSAHLSEGIAISSDASFVLATAVRVRNLLPITQVARGAVMNSAIAYIETRRGGRTIQFPLSEVNAYFADPSGIRMTPDDRLAFVAHGGARTVTVVDVRALRDLVERSDERTLEQIEDDMGASSSYVLARIPTKDNPRTMALSPRGDRLYVAERLAGSIAIIDTARLEVTGRIALGGPEVRTARRRGEVVFHDASVTFQGQFSCRSCHPDGHSDGLVWDFEIDGVGRNLVETRSLQGLKDTAPFKWNGKNPDLETQCGPRFARVLTRSEPFEPTQLADLVAFIESIRAPRRRTPGGFEAAIERGRAIFRRTRTASGEEIPVAGRCLTCHPPPLFTDRLPADVGTGGRFDTPHLFGLAGSAPYLHDGRALSLEEIWTVHGTNDTHGVTSDLTKSQLNDLVTFLRSL